MHNTQFGGTVDYFNSRYFAEEIIESLNTKLNNFNNTISTVSSGSHYHSEDITRMFGCQRTSQGNRSSKVKMTAEEVGFLSQRRLNTVGQDSYKPPSPEFSSINSESIIQVSNKGKEFSSCSRKKRNSNSYLLDNYLSYIWQIGDEFSEIHFFFV